MLEFNSMGQPVWDFTGKNLLKGSIARLLYQLIIALIEGSAADPTTWKPFLNLIFLLPLHCVRRD
jgi:hypothetical protein